MKMKTEAQFQRTRPLPFPTVTVGAHLHLLCATLPHDSANFTGAWGDWLKLSPPVAIACFDERSDYLVAQLGIPPAIASAPPAVVLELVASLKRFRASTGTVCDHDQLLSCWHGHALEWAQRGPAISNRGGACQMVSVRVERHRQRLLRIVTSRRLRSPADRDSALAAFVAMHNCSNPNDVLGGETPMDVLIDHRDRAHCAKETDM